MKHAEYQIPAATRKMLVETGAVTAEEIEAVRIKTPEAETLDEFQNGAEGVVFVENSDPDNVRKLAQSAHDIIRQRRIRERAESDEGITLLKNEGLDAFVTDLQSTGDAFVYGGRQAGTGASAVTKQKARKFDALTEKAKTDPAVRQQLVDLGILSEEEAEALSATGETVEA